MKGWTQYPRRNRDIEDEKRLLEEEENTCMNRYCKNGLIVYSAVCVTCTVGLVLVILLLLFLERLGLTSPTQV